MQRRCPRSRLIGMILACCLGVTLASASPVPASKDSAQRTQWSSWTTADLSYVQVRSRCGQPSQGSWELEIAPEGNFGGGDMKIQVVDGTMSESPNVYIPGDGSTLVHIQSRDGCKNLHVKISSAMSHHQMDVQEYNHGKLHAKIKGGGLGFWGTVGALSEGAAAGLGGNVPAGSPAPADSEDDTSSTAPASQETVPAKPTYSDANYAMHPECMRVSVTWDRSSSMCQTLTTTVVNICSQPIGISSCIQGSRGWICGADFHLAPGEKNTFPSCSPSGRYRLLGFTWSGDHPPSFPDPQ